MFIPQLMASCPPRDPRLWRRCPTCSSPMRADADGCTGAGRHHMVSPELRYYATWATTLQNLPHHSTSVWGSTQILPPLTRDHPGVTSTTLVAGQISPTQVGIHLPRALEPLLDVQFPHHPTGVWGSSRDIVRIYRRCLGAATRRPAPQELFPLEELDLW